MLEASPKPLGELKYGNTNVKSNSFQSFDLTQGQPWLVNALAKEIVEEMVIDTTVAITPEHIHKAKEILIERQDTHLDSLAERLREPRVKAIIEPILAGLELGDIPNDDIQFVIDRGLCKMDPLGGLAIANPIYREVLPRVLTVTLMKKKQVGKAIAIKLIPPLKGVGFRVTSQSVKSQKQYF